MTSPISLPALGLSLRASSAVILLAAAATATPEDLTLSTATRTRLDQLEASAGDPETDWNCINVIVGGQRLRAIMPRFLPPNGDFTGDLLDLTRLLATETVLASTGEIGELHDAGVLFGVEYKVFSNDPNPVPGPPLRMDVSATLLSPSGQTLGTMYCFNEGQYAARVGSLGMIDENIVWCGPLGHGGSTGEKSVLVTGNENTFHGDVKANGSFWVNGSNHSFDGGMVYASELLLQIGSLNVGQQVQAAGVALAGAPRSASEYLSERDYLFIGDVSILNDGSGGMKTSDGIDVSGLIYSTGSISIEGNDIRATATFVADQGVEFIGNDCEFQPAVDELLAFSTGGAVGEGIAIPGSNLELTGALIAPGVRIGISGSNNRVYGQLQADRLRIMGTDNRLSNVYRP